MCGDFQGTWYCSVDCPYHFKKKVERARSLCLLDSAHANWNWKLAANGDSKNAFGAIWTRRCGLSTSRYHNGYEHGYVLIHLSWNDSQANSDVQNHHAQKRCRALQDPLKLMIMVCYDYEGIILVHTVPHGMRVNADYYSRYLEYHLRRPLGVLLFYIIMLVAM